MKALVKIGGTLLDDASSRASLAWQLARLTSDGVTLPVVHGGGSPLTRFLEVRGRQSTFVRGLRVTNEDTIDAVLKVLAGAVNTHLVSALNLAGARAVGLTGIDAGLAVAEQLDPELGFVGRVTGSDPRILDALAAAGCVPAVACIAGGRAGEVFNVNGDSMAVAVASSWKADRLVFLTDVPGVLDAEQKIVPLLTPRGCRDLIAAGVATGGMQAKLDAATAAVEAGVREVRIVRGTDEDIVTRIFAGEGSGDQTGTRIADRNS